jgi:hypothetical protein
VRSGDREITMKKDSTSSDDELREPTPQEVEYFRKQKNQYAKLSVALRDDRQTKLASPIQQPQIKMTATKEHFEAESRRILGLYVPQVERGRLPQHYRDFITRNAARSGIARYKVLERLRSYDISDIRGLDARFNREKETITEAKLKEVEQAADVED